MACPLVPVLPDAAQWLWLGGYFPLLIFLGILSVHYTPREPSVPGLHSHKDKPRGLFSCPEPLLWLPRQTLLPFPPHQAALLQRQERKESISAARSQPWSELAAACAPAFPSPVLYSPSRAVGAWRGRCCQIASSPSKRRPPGSQPSPHAVPCPVRVSLPAPLFAIMVCSARFPLPAPLTCLFSPTTSMLPLVHPSAAAPKLRRFPCSREKAAGAAPSCRSGGSAGELSASAHGSIFHPCTNVLTFKV